MDYIKAQTIPDNWEAIHQLFREYGEHHMPEEVSAEPLHTPGEWDIRYERDPFDSKQSTLRIIDPATTGHPQGPLTLATINVAAFAPHMEEPFANARLMVTAPELLGMLREAVRLAELNRPMEADTLLAAKAAIAKAENKIIVDD